MSYTYIIECYIYIAHKKNDTDRTIITDRAVITDGTITIDKTITIEKVVIENLKYI